MFHKCKNIKCVVPTLSHMLVRAERMAVLDFTHLWQSLCVCVCASVRKKVQLYSESSFSSSAVGVYDFMPQHLHYI